ncbi:hypothetical protein L6164_003843 [Bauhinia variegata]|uniref:Uncharacterized protein n=1 Tax=Bauhinia variegata TaxID=167791 RepID=A0ACB9Q828_BAUVA|nr:hypothetical protein L6164_003843 [Bauhinia variegata]
MAEEEIRYAVVTGANKGIGLAISKQLASNGITVLLTARDEKKGIEAVEKLKNLGLTGQIFFHQLDVIDPASIASLADFIKAQFGKLDILVNNAGANGAIVDPDALAAAGIAEKGMNVDWSKIMTENYELAEVAVKTNYNGAKALSQALIPLLQLSKSPKIISISAAMGMLENLPNGWAKEVLSDVENLDEEEIDEISSQFLKDFKENALEAKGWPTAMSAYSVSKAALNAYTRVLAKKHQSFCINAVVPGYVKTDMTCNTGTMTPDEGAEGAVRLALLPNATPSGLFFFKSQQLSF